MDSKTNKNNFKSLKKISKKFKHKIYILKIKTNTLVWFFKVDF